MLTSEMSRPLIYQVAVGPMTKLYKFCTDSVRQYAFSIGADYHLQTDIILGIKPNPRRSQRSPGAIKKLGCLPIFEKECAFAHFWPHRDQIAIIDSDVWVRPGSPNVFDCLGDADFAGVRERDTPSTPKHKKKLRLYSAMSFDTLRDVDWNLRDGAADFMNMGVMVMGGRFASYLNGETPREFLSRPEFQRFVDGEGHLRFSTDQLLLNWWIKKTGMKVKNLGWEWNCLYGASREGKVKEANFVHFFLSQLLSQKGENISELENLIS